MIINCGIPIFNLKCCDEFIFACGGGGNKDYGKSNGIYVASIKNKDFHKFYETVDTIHEVEVIQNEKEFIYYICYCR